MFQFIQLIAGLLFTASFTLSWEFDMQPHYQDWKIDWFSSADTDCSNTALPGGDHLAGYLTAANIEYYQQENNMWDPKISDQFQDMRAYGACFNLDWWRINAENNKNDNKMKSTGDHFRIQIDEKSSFNTILFFARANCDGQSSDIVSYAPVSPGYNNNNCFKRSSSDYTYTAKGYPENPEALSFYLISLLSSDSKLCHGEKIENGCKFPTLKKDPVKQEPPPPPPETPAPEPPAPVTTSTPTIVAPPEEPKTITVTQAPQQSPARLAADSNEGDLLKPSPPKFTFGSKKSPISSGTATTATGPVSLSTSKGDRSFTTVTLTNGAALVAVQTNLVVTYAPILVYSENIVDNGAGLTLTQTVGTSSSMSALGTGDSKVSSSTVMSLPGGDTATPTTKPITVFVTDVYTRKPASTKVVYVDP